MGILSYGMIASLDGYVAGPDGDFSWAEPDEEVHRFVNERDRHVGTYLYGRRMFEVMRFWDDDAALADAPEYIREYAAIWQAADKVVFSTSIEPPSLPRTRLERRFDPDAIRALKSSVRGDLAVAGAGLAAAALRADLVDELTVYVAPVSVGEGTPLLPRGLFLRLELLEERRFASGMLFLRYRVLDAPEEGR